MSSSSWRLKKLFVRMRPGWLRRQRRAPAGPRRGQVTHVILMDGTMSTLAPGRETNVGLIYKLMSEQAGAALSVYYEAGIQWTSWGSSMDVIMGRGINRQIRRAYGYLASRYRPGDRIFLIGYSRGAYAVRSLAGIIDRVGLVRDRQAIERNIDQAYRLYQEGGDPEVVAAFRRVFCHEQVQIEMIGAFDTVKSLGLRLPLIWRLAERKHAFHNHHLSHCVRSGFHALALQEGRQVFAPVMWQSEAGWQGRLEQVWFAGTHGDVGGQIGDYTPARPFSNIPLVWMLERAAERGLPLAENWQCGFPLDPGAPSIGQWRGYSKFFLLRRRRRVGDDPSERLHESVQARGVRLRRGQEVLMSTPSRRHAPSEPVPNATSDELA